MTSKDPVATETYHHLFGRTLMVTVCEADPESVAKVVQIQEELMPKVQSNDSQSCHPDAETAGTSDPGPAHPEQGENGNPNPDKQREECTARSEQGENENPNLDQQWEACPAQSEQGENENLNPDQQREGCPAQSEQGKNENLNPDQQSVVWPAHSEQGENENSNTDQQKESCPAHSSQGETENLTKDQQSEVLERCKEDIQPCDLPCAVASDGPCLSRPKKEKEKHTESEDVNLIASQSMEEEHDLATWRKTGEPDTEQKLGDVEKSFYAAEQQNEPSDDDSGVDSSVSRGYSSQETLPEENSDMKMEVSEEDIVSTYQEELGADPASTSSAALSVSDRIDIEEYSKSEWKGTTYTAQCVRAGYLKIMEETGCSAMHVIRGDNYCGLRATCFQILSQNLKILRSWENSKNGIDDIMDIPQKLLQNHRWLKQWSFAGRLLVTPKKTIDTIKQCLVEFCNQLKIADSIETFNERKSYFLQYFNSGNHDEVLLFEAVKLLMLHAAILLHEDIVEDKEVPIFASLLFGRDDTSQDPEHFMTNHLNTVGHTGGLEQVEMFLLGYALDLTIRVARPSKVQDDDFITYYPDHHKDDWDMCNLIAEDDRHYNVLVL